MRKLILSVLMLVLALVVNAQTSRPSVTIFGDSYSTFEGYLTPDTMETWYFDGQTMGRTNVTEVSQTWWWQLIKQKGWKLETNNSWSGSTICNTGYNDADATYKSFVSRVPYLGRPDIILIFGATNDAWANVPLGEFMYKDWRRADLYCFRPAMAYLLTKIQDRYPTADVYFISNCDLKESITQSVHQICKHYGVPVIQLQGISKTSGHPNIEGMKQIADQIAKAIK